MVNNKHCTVWKPTSTDPTESRKEWLERRKTLLTASDVAAALGDNPFKNPIELWREKTGRDTSPDLSDNPNVQYGIENEDRIRNEFMEQYGSFLSLEYHAEDICISKQYPFLGATLDGELTVTSYDNPWGLKKGAKGIYEGKTFAFKSRDAFESWNTCPLHYKEQVLAQLLVTGYDFAVLNGEMRFDGDPEFQGNLPSFDTRTFLFIAYEEKDAMKNVLDGAKAFWTCVENDTKPVVSINSTDGVMALANSDVQVDIELKAETKMGSFVDNFSAIQLAVEEMVKPFKGLVFTPDQTKDAKKIKADLNKKKKTIDDVRKNLKKEYCKPLDEFEERAKKLVGIIDNAIAPIDAQIKQQEENEREEKLAKVKELWAEVLVDLTAEDMEAFTKEEFNSIDPRWLNKTCSLASIRKEMEVIVKGFVADLETIGVQAQGNTELLSVMKMTYFTTHRLGDAVNAKVRYLATKEAEEKARQAALEAERRAAEERASAPVAPVPEEPQREPEKVPEPKEIVFTFKASHTSAKEWANLIRYMAEHGFRYTQVK